MEAHSDDPYKNFHINYKPNLTNGPNHPFCSRSQEYKPRIRSACMFLLHNNLFRGVMM